MSYYLLKEDGDKLLKEDGGAILIEHVAVEVFPTVIARIAFDDDPFAAAPVWTTLTGEVLSCATNRGRKHALDRVEAGTTTIVIKNLAGNYWPDNSGGSYYGKILPVKRINIRATFNGTTYDLYTGFIESWKPSWLGDSGIGAIMTLTCSDLFKNLSFLLLNDGGGYAEELSGTRIGNVLDDLNWPAGNRDLDAGQSLMQATGALANIKAMEHLFEVDKSEAGLAFIAGDGKFTFHDRHARLKAPYLSSLATFGNGGGEMRYTDIDFSFDDQFIFNDVRIQRAGGAEQVATDATSQGDYGKRGLPRSNLLMTTDGEALDQANFLLNNYKNPKMRVNSITLKPSNDPSNLFAKALGYDISDRITVNLTQASVDEDYHIEGISHRFRANKRLWVTEWQLSPASLIQYWLIGTAGYSEIGETTFVGY